MERKKKKYKTINLEGREYVNFKCDILKEMHISLPSKSELDRLSNCTVVAIDNYFRSLMVKK